MQGVLRSRQLKDDPTAVFLVLLLERYSERLTEEQTECILQWEAELCQISPEAQQQATRSRAQAFVRLQHFLAQFVDEIVQLQRQNLRDVVMSNTANTHAAWNDTQEFLDTPSSVSFC